MRIVQPAVRSPDRVLDEHRRRHRHSADARARGRHANPRMGDSQTPWGWVVPGVSFIVILMVTACVVFLTAVLLLR